MPSTVRADRSQHQDNDGVLPLVGAVPNKQRTYNHVGKGTEQPWFLGCVARALKACMTHKALAIDFGKDKGNLTRMLAGESPFDLRLIDDRFGEDFASALIDELRAKFNLDDDRRRLARAMDALHSCLSVIAEIAQKNLK